MTPSSMCGCPKKEPDSMRSNAIQCRVMTDAKHHYGLPQEAESDLMVNDGNDSTDDTDGVDSVTWEPIRNPSENGNDGWAVPVECARKKGWDGRKWVDSMGWDRMCRLCRLCRMGVNDAKR